MDFTRRWDLRDHIMISIVSGFVGLTRFWIAFGADPHALFTGFVVGAILGFVIFGLMFLDKLFAPNVQVVKNVTLGPGAKIVQIS